MPKDPFEDWVESWGYTLRDLDGREDELRTKFRSPLWSDHWGPNSTSFRANFKAPDFDQFTWIGDAIQFGIMLGNLMYFGVGGALKRWAGATLDADYSNISTEQYELQEELSDSKLSGAAVALKGYMKAVESCVNEGQMVIIINKFGTGPFEEIGQELEADINSFGEYPVESIFSSLKVQVSPRYGDAVDGPLRAASETMAAEAGLPTNKYISTKNWYQNSIGAYDQVFTGWGAKKKAVKVPKVSATFMPMTFENMEAYTKATIYAKAGFRVVPSYMKSPGDLWTWSPGMTPWDRIRLATPGRGLPKVPSFSSPNYDRALETYLRRNAFR